MKDNLPLELLREKLELIAEIEGDPEISHEKADEALLEYVNDPSITELFEKIKKWYA